MAFTTSEMFIIVKRSCASKNFLNFRHLKVATYQMLVFARKSYVNPKFSYKKGPKNRGPGPLALMVSRALLYLHQSRTHRQQKLFAFRAAAPPHPTWGSRQKIATLVYIRQKIPFYYYYPSFDGGEKNFWGLNFAVK